MTKSQQELRFDSGTPEGDVTSSSQLQEEESVYAEGGRGGLRAPSGRLNTSLTHGILMHFPIDGMIIDFRAQSCQPFAYQTFLRAG